MRLCVRVHLRMPPILPCEWVKKKAKSAYPYKNFPEVILGLTHYGACKASLGPHSLTVPQRLKASDSLRTPGKTEAARTEPACLSSEFWHLNRSATAELDVIYTTGFSKCSKIAKQKCYFELIFTVYNVRSTFHLVGMTAFFASCYRHPLQDGVPIVSTRCRYRGTQSSAVHR